MRRLPTAHHRSSKRQNSESCSRRVGISQGMFHKGPTAYLVAHHSQSPGRPAAPSCACRVINYEELREIACARVWCFTTPRPLDPGAGVVLVVTALCTGKHATPMASSYRRVAQRDSIDGPLCSAPMCGASRRNPWSVPREAGSQ